MSGASNCNSQQSIHNSRITASITEMLNEILNSRTSRRRPQLLESNGQKNDLVEVSVWERGQQMSFSR